MFAVITAVISVLQTIVAVIMIAVDNEVHAHAHEGLSRQQQLPVPDGCHPTPEPSLLPELVEGLIGGRSPWPDRTRDILPGEESAPRRPT